MTGTGRVEWKNGDVYEGPLTRSRREGVGEIRWANGQRYKGGWVADQATGRGQFEAVGLQDGAAQIGAAEGNAQIGCGGVAQGCAIAPQPGFAQQVDVAAAARQAAFCFFFFFGFEESFDERFNEMAMGSHLFRNLLAQKTGRLKDHKKNQN